MATAATKLAEFVFEWDGRDRNGKQVRGETRAGFSEQRLEMNVAIVERTGQVRTGPSGLATTHRAIVDHGHLGAIAHERVGNAQAGDPGADDQDVGLQIVWNWIVVQGQLVVVLPDRCGGSAWRGRACTGHLGTAKQVSSRGGCWPGTPGARSLEPHGVRTSPCAAARPGRMRSCSTMLRPQSMVECR